MKIRSCLILILAFVMLLGITACSARQADAPSGMIRLSNDYVDYNMFVPEAWTIITDENTSYLSAYFNERDRSNITVTAFEVEKTYASLDEFWADYEAEFQSTFSDMEYSANERMLLDQHEAKAVEYTATVTGVKYKYMQIVCVRGTTAYLITYTATEENYDDHIDTIWAVINEFSFK